VVTKRKVKHLIEARRALYEGKRHKVCLMIVPIPEERVTVPFVLLQMLRFPPQRICHAGKEA
jgi:hypothetical protein